MEPKKSTRRRSRPSKTRNEVAVAMAKTIEKEIDKEIVAKLKEMTLMQKLGIEEINLLSITGVKPKAPVVVTALRPEDRHINIFLGTEKEQWIKCYTIVIKQESNGLWTIGSALKKGATDEDHDTAWAFRFKAVGVTFEKIEWGLSHFYGWIATPQDEYDTYDLRIPKQNYNPINGSTVCRKCNPNHHITQQLPKSRAYLVKKLAGLYFSITIPSGRGAQ